MNIEQTIINGRPAGEIVNPDFENKKLLCRALYKYHLYSSGAALSKLMDIDFIKNTYKPNTVKTYLNCVKYYIKHGHSNKRTSFSQKLYTYIQEELIDKHTTPLRPTEAERDKNLLRNTSVPKKGLLDVHAEETPAVELDSYIEKDKALDRTILENIRRTAQSSEKTEHHCHCKKEDRLDKVIKILELLCEMLEK